MALTITDVSKSADEVGIDAVTIDNGATVVGAELVEYERGDMLSLSIYWGTEGCFTGDCAPLAGQAGFIDRERVEAWWPADNHTAMWGHLLKCIAGEAEPVATTAHAAGAVADVWRCYEAAGVRRP